MPVDCLIIGSPLLGSGERGLLFTLLLGWLLDLLLGDPAWLPHPVVGFGKAIAFCEHRLNRGSHRKVKGAFVAIGLIAVTYIATCFLCYVLNYIGCTFFTLHSSLFTCFFEALIVFFCLAGTTLIREVRAVFLALDRSLEEGRKQVARIVGRDTSELSAQEVRTAALETLAENLSDGVIAPLFWFAVLGVLWLLGSTHRRYCKLYPRPSYRLADGCCGRQATTGELCVEERPPPRFAQQRLSGSGSRWHLELSFWRSSLLLRPTL